MGNWATRYRKEHPTGQDRRKASEAAEIAELMAEVRELRHENEFLKKQPPGLRRNDRDRGATEVGAAKKVVTQFPRCVGGRGHRSPATTPGATGSNRRPPSEERNSES